MRQVKTELRRVVFVAGLLLTVAFMTARSTLVAGQAQPVAGVTVFEGARVIVGDGTAPIENAATVG